MKKDELLRALEGAGRTGGRSRADAAAPRKIDEKLAEVLGLARAARTATTTVAGLPEVGSRRALLEEMGREAEETAARCEAVASRMEGRAAAIAEKAKETADEGTEMMRTYLGDDADALDGFEFLVMAEASELGHWAVLREMNRTAGDRAIQELTDFAVPVQERHCRLTLETCLAIAAEEDPLEEA